MIGLLRFGAARGLHQACILMEEFAAQLGPVQPVITAFQLRPEQGGIVPGVHRQARQAETIIARFGPADDR